MDFQKDLLIVLKVKIIVLNNGKIVDRNSSTKLFKKPKKYTKRLIDAII